VTSNRAMATDRRAGLQRACAPAASLATGGHNEQERREQYKRSRFGRDDEDHMAAAGGQAGGSAERVEGQGVVHAELVAGGSATPSAVVLKDPGPTGPNTLSRVTL